MSAFNDRRTPPRQLTDTRTGKTVKATPVPHYESENRVSPQGAGFVQRAKKGSGKVGGPTSASTVPGSARRIR